MVALTSEQQSKTKFYLEYNLATPAADLARLQRAMTEIPDTWTLTRIGDLISRCDDAYELLELAAGALTSDEQTAITGDVVRTTVTASRDSYNRRQRYFLDCTSYLAKSLGVRNFRDPQQVAAAHFLDGGLYINSIPGVDGNDGASAYQVALDNGFVGTEAEWLDSLVSTGLTWMGTWNSATAYLTYDVVSYNGSAYIANAPNTNKTPGVASEWDLWVAKGDTGATGPSTPLNPAVFPHIATPSDPGTGNTSLYAKTDGKLYYLPTGGSETEVGSGSGGREVLTGNRTYYVRTDGSDSNNGLANTAGGAFLTPGKALQALKQLDGNGYEGFVQFGDGTYTLTSTLFLNSFVGFFRVTFQGNSVTPANVVFTTSTINDSNTTNNSGLFVVNGANTCLVLLKDFKVQCTTTTGFTYLVRSLNGGYLQVNNIDFGAGTSGATTLHFNASAGIIEVVGNYNITGGANWHMLLARDGLLVCQSRTVTLTGTPNFSTTFLTCIGSQAYINGNTYSGSATGTRYAVSALGYIQVSGGGATYLPGNVNGTVDATTYGVYA